MNKGAQLWQAQKNNFITVVVTIIYLYLYKKKKLAILTWHTGHGNEWGLNKSLEK